MDEKKEEDLMDFPVDEKSAKQKEQEELIAALKEKYPALMADGLPSRKTMIASLIIFLVSIAGVITGFCLDVTPWIKAVVIISSALLLLIYSLIFRSKANAKTRERLQYAYDFAKKIEDDYFSGAIQDILLSGIQEQFETNLSDIISKNDTNMDMISIGATTKTGKVMTLDFCKLSAEISFETDTMLFMCSLHYPVGCATNEYDKDGYALKDTKELYEDMIAIINDRAQRPDDEIEEEI